jgi:flagellar hook-associated protein 1 FlgK
MNTQHALGLDLRGQPGGELFTPVSLDTVLQPVAPAIVNTGGADLHVAIADVTLFVASDYQVDFSSATAGSITRKSDGKVTAFDFATPPVTVDGLRLSNLGAGANAGDRFYLKPFSNAASNITREFSAAASLAVASPIVGQMGSNNTGSLQLTSLATGVNPPANVPVTIRFTSASSFTRSDVAGTFTYTSGQAILGGGTPNAWSLVLQGAPRNLDTFTVQDITATSLDPKLNGGNATALMNLRDVATFDGAAMTDGYASLIAQIGIRTQSANYSATVSTNIATTAEKDRAGVAGVNLDEEAAKLLQYQQAYQASAKMIQIAQSIFDTLIQTLGR